MIPISLSLAGFLSYRDQIEIDFQSVDLACISGANGAGKSSILDGITFALFGQARKRDDSLVNTHPDVQQAEVILIFDYERNRYKVQRIKPKGKSSLVEFHIEDKEGNWKALSEHSIRETDARIQETLRLDYETFVNAAFFLQGKADQFTQQRPGDRKRILGSILGLEAWEKYRARSGERRRGLDAEISSLEGRIREINEELAEEDERKAKLKELNAELERLQMVRKSQARLVEEARKRSASLEQQAKTVATLAEQVERLRRELQQSQARKQEREAESGQFADVLERKAEIQAGNESLGQLRAELAELDKQAEGFYAQDKQRGEHQIAIEREKARLQSQLEGLEKQEQEVRTQTARLQEIEAALKNLATEGEALESAGARRAELEEQLKLAGEEQARLSGENPLLKDEMDALVAKIKQIQEATGATCPTCGQDLTEAHRSDMVQKWESEGKQKGDRWRENKAALDEAKGATQALEKEVAAARKEEEGLRASQEKLSQAQFEQKELQGQLEIWEKEGRDRLEAVQKQLSTEDFAIVARKALAGIEADLQALGYDAARHSKVREQIEGLQAVGEDFRLLEKAEASLQPLQREIEGLVESEKSLQEELADLEKKHSEAAAALASETAGQPELAQLEKDQRDMMDSENQMQQEVGAASQRVAVLDDIRKRKKGLEGEREEIARQVGQLQALERAFGKDGVPAMLIEQALPQIETKANEILERLSGGAMSIRFRTQADYKDKKREDKKETLDIQISDNQGTRDYEMFSGGEAFRINFAIRLALSEVLAQRAGARLQTLVIDEGFGSQDEMGRQRLIEAINLVKDDFAKILVITHIDSLKDAFPTRIEVEKGPRGSFVSIN